MVASALSVTVRLAVRPFRTIVPKFSEPVAVSVSGRTMRAEADGGAPVTLTGAAAAGTAAKAAAARAAIFKSLVMAIPHRFRIRRAARGKARPSVIRQLT